MGKPTLGQLEAAVLDPLYSDNYQFLIPNLPAGVSDSTNSLLMLCRTATKPGVTVNAVEVQLYGHTLEYASNVMFGHDLSIDYVENRQARISSILETWASMIRKFGTQHGAFKSEYAVTAYLDLFDQKGNTIRKYHIFGVWPSSIPDLSMDGQSSNPISVNVTFKYDHWNLAEGSL